MKQRLLGAAVLIALAVIFLPMFFSGAPPQSQDQSISLAIPAAPDSDLQTRTFDVSPAAGGSASAAPADRIVTRVIPDRAPPPPQPTHASAPSAAPGAEAPVQPGNAPSAGPDTSAAESLPPAAPGRGADQRFAVSVGVFTDASGARRRESKARSVGYPVFTEQLQVDGKPATGVRLGPFRGRAAAEAARLKAQAALPGVHPSLVAWSQGRAKDAPASAVAADQAGGWDVQLAAFSDKSDALAMRDRARHLGFGAFVDSVPGDKGTLWRVRVGPRTQRSDAEKLNAQLQGKMKMKGIVVPHR
ncbi:MAG TPA: SPOR domain-containing protein [Rhodanobacteraceae bacterium]|nr:SPOR domain-containing protein [Rhodanobacteraceae bacterium]